MSRLLRAITDQIDVSKRTVPGLVNTDDVDSYRTIILPEGGDLERYLANPVLGVEHGSVYLPVGRALEIKRKKSEIRALFQFDADEESDKVFQKYVNGTMRGFSIDFFLRSACWSWQPEECWKELPAFCRTALKKQEADGVIYKWELASIDCCAVPSNPRTLSSFRSAGGDDYMIQSLADQVRTMGNLLVAVTTELRAARSAVAEAPAPVVAEEAAAVVTAETVPPAPVVAAAAPAPVAAAPCALIDETAPAAAEASADQAETPLSPEDAELEQMLAGMTDEELAILATELVAS